MLGIINEHINFQGTTVCLFGCMYTIIYILGYDHIFCVVYILLVLQLLRDSLAQFLMMLKSLHLLEAARRRPLR
jgi:hypothetical protein